MIVFTREQLAELVDAYSRFDAFAFDVETRGGRPPRGEDDVPALDPMTNEVGWIAFAGPGRADVIPMGHRLGEELTPLTKTKEPWWDEENRTKTGKPRKKWRTVTIEPTYSEPPKQLRPGEVFAALEPLFFGDAVKIGHKVKFDLESVAKYYGGAVPSKPYFCTLTCHHIANELIPNTKLKQLVPRYFDFAYEDIGSRWDMEPFSKAARYARLDAKYTWLLYRKIKHSLERQKIPQGVIDLDMDVLAALCRSEIGGALIDRERHAELREALEREIEDLTGKLYRYAGSEWDINSQQQQGRYVYEIRGHKVKHRTKGGKDGKGEKKPSTTEAHLAEYASKDPAVQTLMDYKEKHKLYSTYVRGIGDKMDDQGLVHADFTLHIARTGRLSCNKPNLHNIPRPGGEHATAIRGMFIAPPKHKLIVSDYAQQEYRILAHFSQDPRYMEIFLKGEEDPHVLTAVELGLADHPDDVTREMRDVSKNAGFALVYGAGDDKVATMSGVSISQARKVLARHRKTFPGVYRWIDATIRQARRRKPPYVETLLGRRRRLPTMLASDKKTRSAAERQAVNTPIQGTAAELTKIAIVRIDALLEPGMHQSLNVHDELVIVAPEERAEVARDLVVEAMVGEEMQTFLSVPLTTDPVIVDRWSEAKG